MLLVLLGCSRNSRLKQGSLLVLVLGGDCHRGSRSRGRPLRLVLVLGARVVEVLLVLLLLVRKQRVLQRQVVPAVYQELVLEVGRRVHVLAGLPLAATLFGFLFEKVKIADNLECGMKSRERERDNSP